MKIFDNLSIKGKFLFIVIPPLAGFSVFVTVNLVHYKQMADLFKKAVYHTKVVKALEDIIHEIQKERALSLANIERDKLHKQRKNTDDANKNLVMLGYTSPEEALKILRQKVDSEASLQTIYVLIKN